MNPKNNYLALIVLVLMVSCEKELPIYDERDGYIKGIINEENISIINNKDDTSMSANYSNDFVCDKVIYLGFIFRTKTDYGSLQIFIGFKDINKISRKCFDKFEIYNKQGQFIQNCDFKPVLAGCYDNDGQCDMPYLPDSTKKSTIHIDKVTDKYITGRMDVYVISKDLPDNFPWTKIQPKTIHLKVDKFVAVKR